MTVRFRMYRQGLGDCFLLSFAARGGGSKHLLVDCGVLVGSSPQKLKDAVADIQRETSGRLDWVSATHEHWDHISGFYQEKDAFDAMAIGEVWLAWTENLNDALGRELRADRAARLEGLRTAAAAATTAPNLAVQKVGTRAASVLDFFGPAAGAGRTSAAMDYVRNRLQQPRYLEPGMSFPLDGVAGVTVFVLGPPRNERYLHKSRPSKKAGETYVRPALSHEGCFLAGVQLRNGQTVDDGSFPFDEHWRIGFAPSGDADLDQFLQQSYRLPGADWRTIDDDWLSAAGELALQLDSDTNNTSLVLAIEISEGGGVILLPADAQVGNWLSWKELQFQVPSSNGLRRVNADDLLARTVLYKVGHHGSHNATLRAEGLEKMSSEDLVAMIPVDSETAQKKKWNMPLPALYDRLLDKARGRVVRLDEGLPDLQKLQRLEPARAGAFLAKARETELYLDVELG